MKSLTVAARFTIVTVLAVLVVAITNAAWGGEVASSENFLVVAPDQALADDVLDEAERLRKRIANRWFGAELPAGQGKTIIHFEQNDSQDKSTFWPIDHPLRTHHRIWLTTSVDKVFGGALAHEISHLVLLVHYGELPPAWLDEGLASYQDDEKRTAIRRRILGEFVSSGQWPSLQDLLSRTVISAHDQATYTAATSFTELLLVQRSPQHLLEFAAAGKTKDWEHAAQDTYGMSLAQLERTWHAWVQDTHGQD